MIENFSNWVATTSLSDTFKEVSWVVPLSQTIHILAIAAIFSAFVLMGARAIGITARVDSMVAIERRFMPWVWIALIALTATGLIQLIAEPERSFTNFYFQIKMGMVIVVVALAWLFHLAVRRDPRWSTAPVMPPQIRALLGAAVVLLVAIIFCGRWIAYSSV